MYIQTQKIFLNVQLHIVLHLILKESSFYSIFFSIFSGRIFDIGLDAVHITKEISKLILDEDVTNQKGIYKYVLTKNEKFLNIRAFSDQIKQRVYEKQKGICAQCKETFDFNKMDGDHIKKWVDGGKTEESNCQMLCVPCNRGEN